MIERAKDTILLYVFVSFVVLIGVISYYRFIVKQDYIVSFEGTCDIETSTCFVGYDDTEEEYYYSKVQKYAPDLYAKCGEDITDCEAANVCFPDDRSCSITYCNETKDEICKVVIPEQS